MKKHNTVSAVKRNILWLPAIILIVIVSFMGACLLGSAGIEPVTIIKILGAKLMNMDFPDLVKSEVYIIWDLRMPRAILAVAVGGGLAVSGAAMQAVTKNVMGDPYILGVSSGALALVSIGYMVGGTLTLNKWFIPALAFTGAVMSLLFVFAICGGMKNNSTTKLVLAGTAISVTLNAVSQYCIYNSSGDTKANSIVNWMMGSLASARWDNIAITFAGCFLGFGILWVFSRAFDLIALGDDTALSLGVNVSRIKCLALVMVAVISGFSVASCGIIGLVGFVIPHIVRFLCGSEHRKLFPMAFLAGGIFLMWMDVLARLLMAPHEVPIGIFTALCGGPYFIWIIRKKAKG